MTASVTYYLPVIIMLNVLLNSHAKVKEPNTFEQTSERKNLSVLLVSSLMVGHQFPVVALGEELASRGHKVAILAPALEGSTVLTNLPNGVEFISVGTVTKKTMEDIVRRGKNVNVLSFLASKDDPFLQWLVNTRKAVDRLDPSRWDYVVVDSAAVPIMYYVMKQWKTNKVMGYMSPLFAPIATTPPWPSPAILSGLKENMSFIERLSNEVAQIAIQMAWPFLAKILEPEDCLKLGEDYFGNMGVTHSVLLTTVIGFEYPRPLLPLMHYTGPLFMRSYPPLDPQLQGWLEDKKDRSVVYISMGSMAELTSEQGRSILEGIMASHFNYSVVWALRESNRNAIEEVKIDPKRIFIASWISQFTMLGHKTVAMAILHCGLGGVQEALYNKIPVICVPYGYDQFDIAARLEDWGLGIHINTLKLNEKEVSNVVERVGGGALGSKVEKMSIILRASGGTKAAADLVELYAEVGHEHGVPAFAQYKWGWVEYYNMDVWGLILMVIGVLVWMMVKCLKMCYRVCFRWRY